MKQLLFPSDITLKSKISINLVNQFRLNNDLLNKVNSESEHTSLITDIDNIINQLACSYCSYVCEVTSDGTKLCQNPKCRHIEIVMKVRL